MIRRAYTDEEHDDVYAIMLALNTEQVAHIWRDSVTVMRCDIQSWTEKHPGFSVIKGRDGTLTLTYFGKKVSMSYEI